MLGYSHFWPGGFVRRTGAHAPGNWFMLQVAHAI
jgi:hypothetical protein